VRVVQTLNAFILIFIALWCRGLAVDRVDGAGLRGFVAKIVAVAKQGVACGRQAGTAWAVGIAGASLPHACSARADPLTATAYIGVVVDTLIEEVTVPRTAEVRCQIAVRVGRAPAAGLSVRRHHHL